MDNLNYPLLPQSIEAEESILGGILLDPEAIIRVSDILFPEVFFVSTHQDIYRAAESLYANSQPTDIMTVTVWLQDQGLLEKIGGTAKLAQLVDRTVSAVNIDRYAELVRDKYLRRQLISAGHKIVGIGYDTTEALDTCLNRSEQTVFALSQQKFHSQTVRNSEIAAVAYDQLDTEYPIYSTGLYDLDQLIEGFEPGTLTIVAGRPSMGKSQIALFLTLQMLIRHNLPVGFFSLEMTKEQLEYRLWSLISVHEHFQSLGLVPLKSDRLRQHRSRRHTLGQSEIGNIAKIVGIVSEFPLYINDDRSISITGIASESRQIKAKEGKLGLVVVDYLQMMAGEEGGGNRSYELGHVARGLYKLAGDLDVPVLALSQINRTVESRQNKRPMMSDLSQSGILEMVADNVLLAYRDEYYDPASTQAGVLELILGKARFGQTGTAKVLFDQSYGILKNFL
jgi:replicative DNA helicase